MNWRERFADWLTGGSLRNALLMEQGWERLAEHWRDAAFRRADALQSIYDATASGKSGTARKVARIAREALDG